MEKHRQYNYNKEPFKVGIIEPSEIISDKLEGMSEASNSDSVGDCPKRGKEGPCSVSDDPMFIQDQEIEEQWTRIEISLAIIRNLYIERVKEEFWRRAKMMMEMI